MFLSGCLVSDGNEACGKHQVKIDMAGVQHCLCGPGFILDATDKLGCRACGENEDSDGMTCSCKPGYARASEGAPCAISSVGATCSDDSNCGGDSAVCVLDGAEGYCSTAGCSSSNDCEPHWFCEQSGGTSICKKPPNGYRQPCAGADDCAGTAATYCDLFQSQSCLVEGCGKGAPCPGDWSCCNLAVIGASLCLEPRSIMNGICPGGGILVTP
jgi:hypothetical protein